MHKADRIWRAVRGGSIAFGSLQPCTAAMYSHAELAESTWNFYLVGGRRNGCDAIAGVKREGEISIHESRTGFQCAQATARRCPARKFRSRELRRVPSVSKCRIGGLDYRRSGSDTRVIQLFEFWRWSVDVSDGDGPRVQ